MLLPGETDHSAVCVDVLGILTALLCVCGRAGETDRSAVCVEGQVVLFRSLFAPDLRIGLDQMQ